MMLVRGMKVAIPQIQGNLKKLFERMKTVDVNKLKKFNKLTENDGEEGVELICSVFIDKSELIHAYFEENPIDGSIFK